MKYRNIIYSNCAFIRLIIDSVNLITQTTDRKGVIVWDELKRTLTQSGQFLILTSLCGFTNAGKFSFINVERKENSISWKFKDESK